MLVRLALSACLVFGLLFALILAGSRLHRELSAREPQADEAPGLSLRVESEFETVGSPVEALRSFLGVSPARRLEAALRDADRRFLGLRGIALEVPGVADAEHGFDPARIHAIPGTTHTPVSAEHSELMRRAERYALAYNALLARQAATR